MKKKESLMLNPLKFDIPEPETPFKKNGGLETQLNTEFIRKPINKSQMSPKYPR